MNECIFKKNLEVQFSVCRLLSVVSRLYNMKHLPNAFTLLNLFFGCLAIVFVMQNGIRIDEYGQSQLQLSPEMWLGSLCMAIAAFIDFADGFVARLFGASSERGKQLLATRLEQDQTQGQSA